MSLQDLQSFGAVVVHVIVIPEAKITPMATDNEYLKSFSDNSFLQVIQASYWIRGTWQTQ